MKPRFCNAVALATALLGANLLLFAQRPIESAPPQFITFPIVSRTAPTTLLNGYVVFVPTVANEKITNLAPHAGKKGGGSGGGGSAVPPDFGNPGAVVPISISCFPNSTNNVDATCAADSYQGEPMLMFNSGNSGLFGAENDIYPSNCSASAPDGTFGDCGLSATYSPNNGSSWQRFKISRNWGGHEYLLDFDPSVAVDSLGNTFVAFGFADSSGPSGLGVVKGAPNTQSPGGVNWTKTNAVSLNSGSTFDDKPWIAADAYAGSKYTDRLYMAWDRNKSNDQILEISYSSDHGRTWSAPIKINDGTTKFERVIYAFPAVAPNHIVYVLWFDYAKGEIFMDHSTDGGVTWGTDVPVAAVHIPNFGFTDIGCDGGRSMTPAPQMAFDASGNIYVVFADQLPGPGHDFDVFLTKSSDSGNTWTIPVQATDTAAGQQYNPAISIDSYDNVDISYLDRRDDSSNCRTNTYLSQWTFGTSLTKNGSDAKITDRDSDFDGNPNGPGDYSGIAASTAAHPYFSDHRDANTSGDDSTGMMDGGFEIYTAPKP